MKSVTSRNLVGGFLGGVIGILSSSYVAPTFLPLGVLIGVVLGWWNKDIVHLFRESHQKARYVAKKVSIDLVGFTDEIVALLVRLCGLSEKVAKTFRWIIVKAIVGSIVAIITSPLMLRRILVRFSKWLIHHQMNQSFIIDQTIYLLFVLGLSTVAFFVEPHIGIVGVGNRGLLTVAIFIATLGGSIVYRLRHNTVSNIELSELCQYYREWEVISHRGWVGYLFYTIWQHTRYTLGTAMFLSIAVPWFLVVIIIGFLSFHSMLLIIFFAQAFYSIAAKAAHWLCLVVTMITTGISWLIYQQNFADPYILWIVALGTGIMSGGLTEVIRRALLSLYESTEIGLRLKDDTYDNVDDYINFISRIGTMWFRQNRLARIFRFACFDFPIA